MRLSAVSVKNFVRIPDLVLEVREHLVLVGANDVGKTSLLNLVGLVLGSNPQQIYQAVGVTDIADKTLPFLVSATLVNFTADERAVFPDDINIDGATGEESLRIELEVRVSDDDPDSIAARRTFPDTSGRTLSREQLVAIGWQYLPATRSSMADFIDGRRSPLRTLLGTTELGADGTALKESLEDFNDRLDASAALEALRERIADHLSRSMPKAVAASDLSLRTSADPAADVLEDVTLFVEADGALKPLRDQSDGVRQLMTMTFFDLAQSGANIVAVDEPELHLHASSQRTVADLFASGASQRILATHSPYILQRFEPHHVAVVRGDRTVRQIDRSAFSAVVKELANWWSPHLLEALTARHVLLVEGVADRVIVEAAARVMGLNLDRHGVSVLDIGGAEKFKHVNRLLGPKGFGLSLIGLVDKAESGSWVGGLGAKPKEINHEKVFVCDPDLEAEYAAGLGAADVVAALVAEGFKQDRILQSTDVEDVSDLTDDLIAAYARRNKVAAAVAVGAHLTPANISAMPALGGLMTHLSGL